MAFYTAGTNVFADTFIRANSDTVGNGWSEIELAAADAKILSNKLVFNSVANDAAVAYRAGTAFTNIIVTFIYTASNGSGADGFSIRHNGTSRGIQGLYVELDPSTDTASIFDGGTSKGTFSFDFVSGTEYNVEWVITSQVTMEVRIWLTSGGIRPLSPQIKVAAFTPATTTTNWAFGNRFNAQFNNFSVDNLVSTSGVAINKMRPRVFGPGLAR